MIRTFSAFTEEMDDVEGAVSDIKRQIENRDLLANSIGLISCLPAFIETGVYAALAEALPFDLVGQTTIAGAVPGSEDLNILSLFILTSDDLSFSVALTEPITEEDERLIISSYEHTMALAQDRPSVSLILVYAPLLLTVGGDYFVRAFDAASGGVPVFGSLAVDNTLDYRKARVLFRGEDYADRVAYLLIHGEFKPRFYLATISNEKIFSGTGVVTRSQGNQVLEIDGAPAVQFLIGKGLATDDRGVIQGLDSFPYIVDYNDGSDPVVRVIFATTEEGGAVCLGDIPEGSTLSVGYFDDTEILKSTQSTLEKVPLAAPASAPAAPASAPASAPAAPLAHAATSAAPAINGILIFSCLGRFLTLGFEPKRELVEVRTRFDRSRIPYAVVYSGGEICPLANHVNPGKMTTRFHNNTFCMLVL
ncbi:MAG: FIST C-terminal domain-containing protein [Coriobacteriales bacterium]|jgi:hypothetical protein|nr:FIST C-terminal domain-containing protein [Coriobacteriales bacterium]